MQGILTQAGHHVEVNGLTPPRRLARAMRIFASAGRPYDLTIHTERAVRAWMKLSRRNVLIPNPEWLELLPAVAEMDAVLCKTRWTVEVMSAIHPRPLFTGFTSLDRLDQQIERDALRPLHVAGRSMRKGTNAVLEVWRRNSRLPRLTVIAWRSGVVEPQELPENVDLRQDFIDDSAFQRLQMECGFHLCPSEAEGFGHTLVEGMSTGAIVLTTDAPPMNEVVGPERGVLVPWTESVPMRAGRQFRVDPARLEDEVLAVFADDSGQNQSRRVAARKWFEENDAGFRRRLVEVVDELL
ncbi:MAG TPA: glycosyltransferase [Gemmatimonadales bacterium]|nr:glycosyltransferase [Gemmatimonadales bacterium]